MNDFREMLYEFSRGFWDVTGRSDGIEATIDTDGPILSADTPLVPGCFRMRFDGYLVDMPTGDDMTMEKAYAAGVEAAKILLGGGGERIFND